MESYTWKIATGIPLQSVNTQIVNSFFFRIRRRIFNKGLFENFWEVDALNSQIART